jgi:hypothetical protein
MRLPRAEGDAEDGEISVIPAGGTVEANVERWSEQFTEKPKPVLTQKDVSGFQFTIVELEGTFTGMGGAGAKPGTKLLGAIVPLPGAQQLLFFKGYGPKATMERWRPAFDELVSSFRLAK